MEPIPKVGDKHNFFDDGKLRESRHYVAEVLEVITPEEAKNVQIIGKSLSYQDALLLGIKEAIKFMKTHKKE